MRLSIWLACFIPSLLRFNSPRDNGVRMIGYIPVYKKLIAVTLVLSLLLACSMLLGLVIGSSGDAGAAWKLLLGQGEPDPTLEVIVWQLRWPRVILAATVGASLSLGGLVFQALLRNPLAEPYILGRIRRFGGRGYPWHPGRF